MFEPKIPDYPTGMPPSKRLLAFNGVNINNAVFVLDFKDEAIVVHGLDVRDARFDIKMLPSGDHMTIEPEALSLSKEVRLNIGETNQRALNNGGRDNLSFPVSEMTVREFNWFGDEFKVARVIGKLRGDTISVERFRIDLDAPATELGGLVRLSIPKIERHLAPLGIDLIRGPISLQIDGYGEPQAFAGQVEIASPNLNIGGIDVSAIDLTAQQTESGHITISDLNAHYKGEVDFPVLGNTIWMPNGAG